MKKKNVVVQKCNCYYFTIIYGLLLFFTGLKLAGVITWQWWLVLSPLWLPIISGLTFFILGIFIIKISQRIR